MVSHQDLKNPIQTLTIPINNCFSFEIINIFFIFAVIFEFVQNQLYVDFEKVGKRSQNFHKLIFIDDFEGFFNVAFQQREELLQTFLYLSSTFAIVF